MAKSKLKVLIVDDDKLFCDLVRDILADHEVIRSANAVEAIAVFDKFIPDVVIMDLLMPAATGFSLLNEMASYSDLNKIPIVICSNLASEVSAEYLRAAGVCEILDKNTIKPKDIRAAIERLGL